MVTTLARQKLNLIKRASLVRAGFSRASAAFVVVSTGARINTHFSSYYKCLMENFLTDICSFNGTGMVRLF